MEAISLEDRLLALLWTSRCRGPGYQGLLSASSGAGVHTTISVILARSYMYPLLSCTHRIFIA